MSPLDLDKFRKVDALTRSPHEAEARAAEGKAREIAQRAGLTLDEARASATGQPFGLISFDMTEMFTYDEGLLREVPRYRAGWTAKRAASYAELLQARTSVGARHENFEVVLEPTSKERRLEAACGLFPGPLEAFAAAGPEAELPKGLHEAARDAYPLPMTLAGAWQEYEEWGQLDADRWAILADDRRIQAPEPLPASATARVRVLAELLDGKLPARSLTDLLIRLHYFAQICAHRSSFEAEDADGILRPMLRDIAAMVPAGTPKPTAASAPPEILAPKAEELSLRTASERRRYVQTLLVDPANRQLSAREIARRAGVSPQTVINVRSRLTDKKPAP